MTGVWVRRALVALVALVGTAVLGAPSALAASAAASDLRGRVFVLNPGHNGGNGAHARAIATRVWAGNRWKACDTTGTATSAGYTEHSHNWDVALRTAAILRSAGATVILTRSSDSGVGPCITTRAQIGNRSDVDAVVSIHADGNAAPSARGFHVIVGTQMAGGRAVEADSMRLAKILRSTFRTTTGMPYSTYLGGGDALDIRNDLGGLNLSTRPALFIEAGNMRQPTDAALLSSAPLRQKEAEAIAEALRRYVGGPPQREAAGRVATPAWPVCAVGTSWWTSLSPAWVTLGALAHP